MYNLYNDNVIIVGTSVLCNLCTDEMGKYEHCTSRVDSVVRRETCRKYEVIKTVKTFQQQEPTYYIQYTSM